MMRFLVLNIMNDRRYLALCIRKRSMALFCAKCRRFNVMDPLEIIPFRQPLGTVEIYLFHPVVACLTDHRTNSPWKSHSQP